VKKHYYIFSLFFLIFLKISGQDLSVSFEKNERPCVLGEASINIITGSQPIQIVWSTGSISSSIGQLEKGDYSVTITDNLSNDTTINFTIEELICEPIPENNFTPNGDGYNDTWNISRIEHFPNFDLYVYNRWGQLVHRQSGSFTPWDASSILLPLPDATYYYVLYLDKANKKDFIKGDVSIIR
jgi:gliding motility-associated-like protein